MIIYLICVLFSFVACGGVQAVEKKKKDSTKTTKTIKKKPTKPAPSTPKKTPSKKKYDTFIDKNKNGIDDRQEKFIKKKKSSTKKKTPTIPKKP
ncbi:MAG: hypothetical protein DRP45_05135 [Candidatus Zixiibacteriota bacterium]|nr:MAG: hypothetical protein DRP45_05135 [candidate division Zixibacteria bacterium]